MSVEATALLILVALGAGILVGQKIRMGQPRRASSMRAAGGAGAGGRPPRTSDTYSIPVGKQIAAACGCSS